MSAFSKRRLSDPSSESGLSQMRNTNSQEQGFTGNGYFLQPTVISENDCEAICAQLKSLPSKRAGSRRLLAEPWCAELSRQVRMHPVVADALPTDPVAFQCTLFDKSATRNWLVAPHQDLSIPVRSRVNAELCVAWSEKGGSVFTQPPTQLLENLVAVRIHLDQCDEGNGRCALFHNLINTAVLRGAKLARCAPRTASRPLRQIAATRFSCDLC
jgi:hypothetical protein